jgi:phosphate acetyltransferase
MDVIKKVISQAKNLNKVFVFPEGEDLRILKAVSLATKHNIIVPILLGNKSKIVEKARRNKIDITNIKIINPKNKLLHAANMVAKGEADSFIAGAVYTSRDVIIASLKTIGLKKGVSVPSSFFLMDIPNYSGGEKGSLIYSDASVNINPTAKELAEIAIISGQTAKQLLGWDPRVALLSFSTHGSAKHPNVDKVVQATKLAKKKVPTMKIEGELQADAALVPEISKRKIKGKTNGVPGRANVLVFPNLDAGNIAYKLTQRLTNAKAYGPILQGFARPISDLSRGATVDDIVGVIALLSVWCEKQEK